MQNSYTRRLVLPRGSFFLLGIRGTGKTSLVRSSLGAAERYDLLDERLYSSLLADPDLLWRQLSSLRRQTWVVIDEVQRLPNLLNIAHRAIEELGLKFALLGSSARKLKRGGANLLAGRAISRELFPLLPSELGKDFNLTQFLALGSIPLILANAEPMDALRTYVDLYLKEEIKAEALVRSLPGFARFLPIAALYHGQVINVSNIAREAEVGRTTVHGYIEILEDTLMVKRVPGFDGKLRVRERVLPKLYWMDPGIVRILRGERGHISEELRGSLFEGVVHMVLRAHNSYRNLYDELFYWAPSEAKHIEVDFLLKRGREFIAIECKSSSRFSETMLRGLRSISALKGLKRRILVYPGERRQISNDKIEILPLMEFERELLEMD